MPTATSDSHPIRVDFVPRQAHGLLGELGMTFAPGKKDNGSLHWDRDLDADLRVLRETFHAHVLVSLVEDFELPLLQIGGLAEACARAGIALVRYPIRDAHVPTNLSTFAELVRHTVTQMRGGRTVVIHCRGGLGRTGLLAACCLRALGADADSAIVTVRRAREKTIETPGQERFVADNDFGSALEPESVEVPVSRFRGCLLGGALGDSLGEPIEFIRSVATIQSAHGVGAPAKLGYDRGPFITDDTQMTLFAAEGLIRAAGHWGDETVCLDGARAALLRWLQTQGGHEGTRGARYGDGWLLDTSGLHSRRAPGMTCLGALNAQADGKVRATVAHPLNTSKGCGAIMRSAPYGLAAPTRATAFQWARDAGAVTHGHPSGYLSAAHFAAVVWGIARDEPLIAAIRAADGLLVAEPRSHETAAAVARAMDLITLCEERATPPTPDMIELLGEAWVGEEALAIALLCAATCEDGSPDAMRSALWRAVVHGGDSDSTGSLVGNLLGAMHGIQALPTGWVEELELGSVIDRVAIDLHFAAHGTVDPKAYPPVIRREVGFV